MFQASDSERLFCRCRDKMSMYDLPFTSSSRPAQNALSFWRSLKPVWIWESSTFNSDELPVLKSRKFLCLLKGCRLQNGRVGCCCDYLLVASIPPWLVGKRVYFHWELGLTQIPPITRLPHLLPRTRNGGNYKGLTYIMSVVFDFLFCQRWREPRYPRCHQETVIEITFSFIDKVSL